jgi:molybdate transport system ATP-binding protein
VGPDLAFEVDLALDAGTLALRASLRAEEPRIAIVGPSGAGKSALLRALAGLEPRARGRLAFRGETWLDSARGVRVPAHRRRVGWVPQDARLFPHRSVRENLRFSGAADREAREVAVSLGVEGLLDRRPRHLSGGEAQRVALARALLARPRLLLLDEPFAALDRARRGAVAAVLRERSEAAGLGLVLVSHDERDVASLAERVFSLSEGRIETAFEPDAPPAVDL